MAARLPPGVRGFFGKRARKGVALARFSTLFERKARALLPPIERLFHPLSPTLSLRRNISPFPPTFAFHRRQKFLLFSSFALRPTFSLSLIPFPSRTTQLTVAGSTARR